MRKEVFVLLLALPVLFLALNIVSAENLNLTITGTIANYSASVYLKTNTHATTGIDIYDFSINPDNPTEYAKFYSTILGHSFVIDSWNSLPRTIYLVYDTSGTISGNLSLSWQSLSGSSFSGTLTDCGANSSYTNCTSSVDMRSASYYNSSMNGQDQYIMVVISNYTAPSTSTDTSGGGGGGGGGATSGGKTYYPSYSEVTNGTSRNLGNGDAINFTLELGGSEKQQFLELVKISSRKNAVELKLNSLDVNLNIGEEAKVDLRNIGVYDLLIRFNNLRED